MTIVVTGGGSGGHITPVLAVADELKNIHPEARIVYIIQKGDKLVDLPSVHPSIDEVRTIRAGKFRRYHGTGIKHLLDIPTLLKNIRDALFVIVGTWQSYWLLRKLKPAGIFAKGGYVVVPVGLAARFRGIPYITHDSDSVPGLANRIIASKAVAHATGMPKELYPYPQDKTFYTGIPLNERYTPVDEKQQNTFKADLGLNEDQEVIFVTGGGHGALRLNRAVLAIAKPLFDTFPRLCIIHVAGRDHEKEVQSTYNELLEGKTKGRVIVQGFAGDMYRLSGAADVVLSRAGATALAEFAAQHKACVVVPNPMLTGGHQSKNANYWEQQGAVKLVSENQLQDDANSLYAVLAELLKNKKERQQLGEKLSELAHPEAAHDLARLLLKAIKA